jgi:hypothetical protein
MKEKPFPYHRAILFMQISKFGEEHRLIRFSVLEHTEYIRTIGIMGLCYVVGRRRQDGRHPAFGYGVLVLDGLVVFVSVDGDIFDKEGEEEVDADSDGYSWEDEFFHFVFLFGLLCWFRFIYFYICKSTRIQAILNPNYAIEITNLLLMLGNSIA